MTLLFGGISLVLAFLLALVVGSIASARIAADRGDALLGLATGVSVALAEGMQDRLRDVELIAASTDAAQLGADASSAGTRDLTGVLERTLRARSAFAWLGAVDSKGVVRAASGGVLRGQNVGAKDWLKIGMKDSYVGDVHPAALLAPLLPAAGEGPLRLVDFAAPVRDANGRPVGVIAAHGNWEWAGQVARRLRSERGLDSGAEVMILDRAGRVLYRSRAAASPSIDAPFSFQTTAQPTVLRWPDGERYLTAGMTLPAEGLVADLGWKIVARQPESIAMAAAAHARYVVLGFGALAAGCAMALTWLVATWFGRPLRTMALAARRIERGDLTAEIPAVSSAVGSEIGLLSGALSGMTRSLVSAQDALRRSNETLDARVKERTEALRAANLELERLASRDSLTGLYNRRAVDQRLAEEILRHRRSVRTLSVLLIDIDHFKQVNARFGHSVGDDALKAVAQCLQEACRGTDFVARYGGEEFVVLLPDTPVPQSLHVGELLRARIAELDVPIVGRLTISLGLADAPPLPLGVTAGWTAAELLQRADTALYAAKACGRDRLARFEPDSQRVV